MRGSKTTCHCKECPSQSAMARRLLYTPIQKSCQVDWNFYTELDPISIRHVSNSSYKKLGSLCSKSIFTLDVANVFSAYYGNNVDLNDVQTSRIGKR